MCIIGATATIIIYTRVVAEYTAAVTAGCVKRVGPAGELASGVRYDMCDDGGGGGKHGRWARNGWRGAGVGGAIRRGGAPRVRALRKRCARVRVYYYSGARPPATTAAGHISLHSPRTPPRPADDRVGARSVTVYVCVRV